MNVLNANSKTIKILASIFLVCCYIFFFVGIVWYILTIGFAIYAYFEEKKRIERGNDRFRGNNLFFRYGRRLNQDTFPIPVKPEWEMKDSAGLANELMAEIQKAFSEFYGETPLSGKQVVTVIGVTDSERPRDNRGFIKISFKGSRGSIFSTFVTYQLVGKSIVLHRLEYLLGIVQWYEVMFFIISSPISIWFWGWSWLRGEYSIYGRIAGDINNDFEVMDIRAYYTSSSHLISDVTRDILKAYDLLTEEVKQQIINNYKFGNITQNGSGNNIVSNIK